MGLYLKRFKSFGSLGIWEIEESLDALYRQAVLSPAEQTFYASLRTPLRKKHWLGYRMLLPHLLDEAAVSGISYDESGKPHLDNGARHISVAHSGKFSALMTSDHMAVGVDIEAIHPRIFRLTDKFLSEAEMEYTFITHPLESLYLIWCAKEAMYKLDGRGGLSFRDDMVVHPFAFTGMGEARGTISREGVRTHCRLFYECFDNYVLVYTHAAEKTSENSPAR